MKSKTKSHSLNCPDNSLSKKSFPTGSDTVTSNSLSKKSIPAPGGTSPKGFGDKI